MAIDRLIGADASLYTASFGTVLTSGTAVSGQWYKIVSISGTSVFPSGYQVGDLWLGDGTKTFTAQNSAAPATFTLVSDCNGFEINFSADEVDVTTLADSVKKYRKGKADFTGSINGINFISEMRKAGSFVNKFVRTVTASGGTSTINTVDRNPIYGKFYIQSNTSAGETEAFLFAQVELYGYKLGAAIGDVQSYSSNIRVIGNDPILYFKDN